MSYHFFAAQKVLNKAWVRGSLIQPPSGASIIREFQSDGSYIDHSIIEHTITRLKHGHPGFYTIEKDIEEFLYSEDVDFFGGYTINADGEVDIEGDITISSEDMKYLPVKFNIVTGIFEIEDCYKLRSIEGCPNEVMELNINNSSRIRTLRYSPAKCNTLTFYHSGPIMIQGDTEYIPNLKFGIGIEDNIEHLDAYESTKEYYESIHLLWEQTSDLYSFSPEYKYRMIKKVIHDSGDPEDMIKWICGVYPELGQAIIRYGYENNIYVGIHGGDVDDIIKVTLNVNHKL